MTAEVILTKKKEMDLFTLDGLTKQTGVSSEQWDTYIIKELIDNAIDACESAGIEKPEVHITINESSISVKDNANGITKEILDKIIDINTYVGSKHYFKRPARGAQGNALLTILSIPYVFKKIVNTVIIQSRGKEYRINCEHDEIYQNSRLAYTYTETDAITNGTEITVNIPPSDFNNRYYYYDQREYYKKIINNFAVFNPYCTFKAEIHGDQVFHDRIGDIRKTKSGKESVHWYSYQAFKDLVHAYIREGYGDISIKNFCIERFTGISNSTKNEVLLNLMQSKYLNDFLNNHADIEQLYKNLKTECRVVNPSILGEIGKDRLLAFFGDDARSARYKKIEGNLEVNGCITPFVLEGAAVQSESNHKSTMYPGLNNSPLVWDNSISNYVFGDMSDFRVGYHDGVFMAVHLICPNIAFSSYSKAQFDLSPFYGAIEEVLKSILKDYYELRDKANKERQKAYRQERKEKEEKEKQEKREQKTKEKEKKKSIKEIFRETWQKALDETTNNGKYAADIRQVFYKHRPLIEETSGKINYDYYSSLVEELEREAGKRLVNRETRGELVHPRSTERKPINTKFANTYYAPSHEFNKILYIEKRGFLDVLIENEIHSRYDMALIGGQGFLTWDIKKLINDTVNGSSGEINVYCLHDCDISGIQILNAARKEHYTEGTKVNIIDMGITPGEAIRKKYLSESSTSKKSYNYETVQDIISKDEFEWLTHKEGHRVELNIFSPSEFVGYVETKLKEFGVTEKVIPPTEVIEDHINKTIESEKEDMINDAVAEGLSELNELFYKIKSVVVGEYDIRKTLENDFEEHIQIDPAAIQEDVKLDLDENPVQSWRHFTEVHVKKQLNDIDGWDDHIRNVVKANTDSRVLDILKSVVEEISKNQDFNISSRGL